MPESRPTSGRDLLHPSERARAASGSGSAVILLIIVAVLAAVIGVGSLSEATMGVGFLAGACLLGILARIAQAAEHHRQNRG